MGLHAYCHEEDFGWKIAVGMGVVKMCMGEIYTVLEHHTLMYCKYDCGSKSVVP